jgi:hypothetical protein
MRTFHNAATRVANAAFFSTCQMKRFFQIKVMQLNLCIGNHSAKRETRGNHIKTSLYEFYQITVE